jgi:6-phospho-beta-glucosidase
MEGLKITVIGGGSSYTPELVDGFLRRREELPVRELHLVDVPEGEEKLEIVAGLTRRMLTRAGHPAKVTHSFDRRRALEGADFVVTQFRVGRLAARVRDERIPLEFDCLGQETVGAGGFTKAMRTIPVILDICREMRELSPNAWLLNFTNPASMVTEAIIKHGSGVKGIGLCNVPINTEMMAARFFGVSPDRVRIEFFGLNHLVHARSVFVDGVDRTAELLAALIGDDSNRPANIPALPFAKEIIGAMGMIPCHYHHYYLHPAATLAHARADAAPGGTGTRGEVVQRVEAELFELYKNPNLQEKPAQLSQRGGAYYSEAAVRLIHSLVTDRGDIQPVNVRNDGAIADLPENVSVEISCVITKSGPKPLSFGRLPLPVRGLVQTVKAYEELAVEAAVTGDRRTALQALLANPLVPEKSTVPALLNALLEANRDYLPQFFPPGR